MENGNKVFLVSMELSKPEMISIIIPIYNSENYLHRCLDSIEKQSYKEFEALLIDDGSTDRSLSICKQYAERDNRFKVFHNENRGVGATRAFGIEHASGEYSIHVDPDDWIEPDMLELLAGKAMQENADITICDYIVETCGNQKMISQRPTRLDRLAVIYDLLVGNVHGSVCNKLIRTSLYREMNINFEIGLNYYEDILVCISLIWKKRDIRIAYVGQALYHYDRTINPNSQTNRKDRLRLKVLADIYFTNKIESMLDNKIFSHEIIVIKEDILREAFYHNVLTPKEFLSFGKGMAIPYAQKKDKDILDHFVIIALGGSYKLCQSLYSMWVRIHRIKRT